MSTTKSAAPGDGASHEQATRPGTVERFLSCLDRAILRAWRVFVSLKFGIFLLTVIGVLSIYGTMNFASNAALGDNAIPMARAQFFERPWFVGLLLLFAVNLIFSTWHVTKMSCTIWWKKEFRRSREYYLYGKTPRAEVEVEGGPEEVEAVLRRRFTRVHRDGNAWFAHAGILSRLGPTIIHTGILIVIFSICAKAFLMWNGSIITEGRFIAAEGEITNVIHEPIDAAQQITELNRRERPLNVWIRLLDFQEVKYPNSETPAHFRSVLEVLDPQTQQVTVAQVDMNHSLTIPTNLGNLKFHQAGYQALPDSNVQRINFDVRNKNTGERVAVADASPGIRTRIGESPYFLLAEGANPADRWTIYHRDDPYTPADTGLLVGGRTLEYSFTAREFFPDFRINPETNEPYSASGEPNNPALRVAVNLDGREVDTTWLFFDSQLAGMMPESHPRFRLALEDIRARRSGETGEFEWDDPGEVLYVIGLYNRENGRRVGEELLGMGESSRGYEYTAVVDHGQAGVPANEGGRFEVRLVGPTTRYLTVLSVVDQPTVPWTNLGVGLLVIGSMMVFLFRYRAFYGLWDEERRVLHMALVPRWGQSPVMEEFTALVNTLSGGKPPIRLTDGRRTAEGADEIAPEHGTVNPRLSQG